MSLSALPAPRENANAAARSFAVPFRLKFILRLAAVALGVLQAWNGLHTVYPDGVNYLDVATAYLRGDWHAAISTYWSPLYSWLIAGALAVLRPSPYWEFASLKVVNFGIFLAGLAAFEWFLSEALRHRPTRTEAVEPATLPKGVLTVVAYAFFLWSSCVLTSVAKGTPDLLVSVFVYLAGAAVLRARRVTPGLLGSAAFGLILGAGCLAKAVLLPVGLVFLAVSALCIGSVRKGVVHVAVAAAVLAMVFGSFAAAMSARSGRLTLGDVSRLNYLWLVNGVADHGWETDDPRLGTAVHPPRRLTSDPAVYEFAGPVAGTNPLWYDPTYWCDGLNWRLDARRQLSRVFNGVQEYYYIFFFHVGPLTAALVLLHLGAQQAAGETARGGLKERLVALAADYPIVVPSLAAFALYTLVIVEPRYLAGFAVLLGMALLRAVRVPSAKEPDLRRWAWAATVVLVVAPTGWLIAREAGRAAAGKPVHAEWKVTEALQRRGVQPGDRVGHIGSSFDSGWARAGRYKVAAEVRTRDVAKWWAADAARQDALLGAFREAGVVAIVAENVPDSAQGWERIPDTEYAVRMIPPTNDP